MSNSIIEKINMLGGITTLAYLTSMITIFVLRLLEKIEQARKLGLFQTVLALFAAGVLFFTAFQVERSPLYFIQIGLFLLFLILELLVDYIFKIEFRQVRWMVIGYVTFFFAATGGMIGVANLVGRAWTMTSVILYLIMAVLAHVQRAVTGL